MGNLDVLRAVSDEVPSLAVKQGILCTRWQGLRRLVVGATRDI